VTAVIIQYKDKFEIYTVKLQIMKPFVNFTIGIIWIISIWLPTGIQFTEVKKAEGCFSGNGAQTKSHFRYSDDRCSHCIIISM